MCWAYLYLVQQGALTYRHAQFKDLHFSKQLSLFGGEETDSEYSLQTANLHTASLWKGLFPQAGRGIKKDRGLRQADSTPHHAQLSASTKSPLKNSDLQFTLTAYYMHHHPKFLKDDI